jgi:hypothetical protein
MNTLLNNLYDQSIISDFRDKGSIAWVLYKGRPFIVISPYGLRFLYEVIGYDPSEITKVKIRDVDLVHCLAQLYDLTWDIHLYQIDGNEDVFDQLESMM